MTDIERVKAELVLNESQRVAYLERKISKAALELHTATTRRARREAFERLRQLVDRRSPTRVARMEAEKGLR